MTSGNPHPQQEQNQLKKRRAASPAVFFIKTAVKNLFCGRFLMSVIAIFVLTGYNNGNKSKR